MLGRHSPPMAVGINPPEKLKRPNKKGPAQRKYGLQQLPRQATFLLDMDPAPHETTNPPEPLSTPANSAPLSSTSGKPASTPPPSVHETDTGEATANNSIIKVNGIEFHHQSEAEFASLLTYYGIEWQYEPHQFPLQWREGRPVVMFAPDFYLTEYDLYIELTTMRQSLVRRKNRKLRLLRALYPEINIKLLYRRDYQRLLELFGIKPEEIEAEEGEQSGESSEADEAED